MATDYALLLEVLGFNSWWYTHTSMYLISLCFWVGWEWLSLRKTMTEWVMSSSHHTMTKMLSRRECWNVSQKVLDNPLILRFYFFTHPSFKEQRLAGFPFLSTCLVSYEANETKKLAQKAFHHHWREISWATGDKKDNHFVNIKVLFQSEKINNELKNLKLLYNCYVKYGM